MNHQSMFRLMIVAALVMILSVSAATAHAPAPGNAPQVVAEPVAGQVIFQLTADGFASAEFSASLGSVGRTGLASVDERLVGLGATDVSPALDPRRYRPAWSDAGLDRIFIATYDSNSAPKQAADLLAASSAVEFAEPNGYWSVQFTPNDDLYSSQWAHNNTGQAISYYGNPVGTADCDTDTDQAWDIQTGDPNLVVAIIDTGCDLGHPEYSSRLVTGYDFVNNDGDASDDHGHGTSCAGITLATGHNSQGIAGVAWNVKLMPVKVLSAAGFGTWDMIANGIVYAADNGARILSMSLGGSYSSLVLDAVDYAYAQGCAIFASTGNSNASSIGYPAGYANAIAVGAMSPCCERKNPSSCDEEYWWGSNYGTGMDFVTPGVRIHTTDIRGSAGFGSGDYISDFNGTSSACPHAAGIGALVWSRQPSMSNAQVWTILRDTCDDIGSAGYDLETGYGRLNAYSAVMAPVPPVLEAQFLGAPLSGPLPLTVDFTDLSGGTVNSWSWNFGDGGTSTVQNPSHEYTTAGTYTVSLTVTGPGGSDTETKTDYVTASGVDGYWTVITYDDFEAGFGNYTDGGFDCYLYTEGDAAHQGDNAAEIRDGIGEGSSFYHTDGHNVSGYDELEVEFWFYAESMEAFEDGFWVQYFDGLNWHTVATYMSGTDFNNEVFYNEVVTIPDSYSYPGNAKLRFMCNADSNRDLIFIDEVEFRGFTEIYVPPPPVAAFTGSPTVGYYPLAVHFTDQSMLGPTEWYWDFGDGYTSTSRHPNHTYTAAGTYTVLLLVANGAGEDVETKVNYITVTAPPAGTWFTITYDDFESGWGNYSDGGMDCSLYMDGVYAHEGDAAADIRDGNGVHSSFTHTLPQNVSAYSELKVEFWFRAERLDNSDEGFWVQYYDGSTWHVVATLALHTDFENGVFYNKVVTIPDSYTYPTNARLRFQCNANANRDNVYIDEIEFRGLALVGGPDAPGGPPRDDPMPDVRLSFSTGQPSLVRSAQMVHFNLAAASEVDVSVYDLSGRRVAVLARGHFDAGAHSVAWHASEAASGAYFYRITAGDLVEKKRFILLK